MPPALTPQALWLPSDADPGQPPVLYASDTGRRRAALWLAPAALVLGVLAWLLGVPAAASVALAGVVLGAGAVLALSGASGYYTADAAGRPVAYLGRRQPDLSGRTRTRPSRPLA